MSTRSTRSSAVVVVGGLLVALLLATLVSGFASGNPDGLERVAADKGFDETASDSAVGGSPLADYGVSGVDNERVGTGLAGIVGVGLTALVGFGLFSVVRARGSDAPTATSNRAE